MNKKGLSKGELKTENLLIIQKMLFNLNPTRKINFEASEPSLQKSQLGSSKSY